VSKLITHFDNDLGILIVEPEDQLSPQFIIDYYRNLEKNDTYPENLKALCITKASGYPQMTRDVEEIVDALKDACKKYETLKEAFLVEDPFMTVITTLFSEKADIPNYRSRIFSTEEAAIKWLLD